MKTYRQTIPMMGLLFLLALVSGCSHHDSAPPSPLPVEQLPALFEKAFAKAGSGVKEAMTQVVSAVQTNDYSRALMSAQALANMGELTKDQQLLVARAQLTINGLLQTAQAQGDEKAAAILKYQHLSK